jgi:acyl-CoA synthetase (AMP-forming)/AMP-acid ligase II
MFPGAFTETTPDHPAIVMAGSGEVVTYAQLDAEANRVSHLFRSLGLQPGDHVAFCLENHVRLLPLAWGATYAGLYYTALSSRLTTDELAYIVDDCGARVFVTSIYKRDQAVELVERVPGVEARFMIDGTVDGYASYEEALAAQPATPLDEERTEGRDMLYSSGTTGRPKGVKAPLTGAPLGSPEPVHTLVTLLFQGDAASVYLSPAPLYHAAPLRYCLAFQRLGATVVVMDRFEPEEALALIEQHRVTHSQWVPTMFIRMLKLPEEVRHRYDLSSLRFAVHAAAPCPVAVKAVKAVVEPIDWVDAGPDLEAELIAHCRQHLADVKCPRSVDFRPELPRHPTGKLYKRLLKDEYWQGHTSRI